VVTKVISTNPKIYVPQHSYKHFHAKQNANHSHSNAQVVPLYNTAIHRCCLSAVITTGSLRRQPYTTDLTISRKWYRRFSFMYRDTAT